MVSSFHKLEASHTVRWSHRIWCAVHTLCTAFGTVSLAVCKSRLHMIELEISNRKEVSSHTNVRRKLQGRLKKGERQTKIDQNVRLFIAKQHFTK